MSETSAQPKAVILDMDGVLIDSFHPHFVSWRDMLAEVGLTLTRDDFVRTFGQTSREILATLWPDRHWPGDTKDQLDRKKELYFRELITNDFPAMPGVVDLIKSLHTAGWKVAVGSSGPPENVQFAIDRLGIAPYLSGVAHGREVPRGKPDPAVFLLAAQRAGVAPARCIVIEDSPPGIEAALAAGMLCVGLLSTGHTPEQQARAHRRIERFTELNPDVLGEMLNARPVP